MNPEAFLGVKIPRRTILKSGLGFAALELLSACGSTESTPSLPQELLGTDFIRDEKRVLETIKATKDFPVTEMTYFKKTGQVGFDYDKKVPPILGALNLEHLQVFDAADTDENKFLALKLNYGDNVYFWDKAEDPTEFPPALAFTFDPDILQGESEGDEYSVATVDRYILNTETGHPNTPLKELTLLFPLNFDELEGREIVFALNKGLTTANDKTEFIPMRFKVLSKDAPPLTS